MDTKLKKLFISIGCVVICFIATKIVGKVIVGYGTNTYVNECLGELVLVVLSITALIFLKKKDALKFKTEGFIEGIMTGMVILVLGTSILIAFRVFKMSITATTYEVIVFVIYMLLVGIAEEVLFRGIIQNQIMECIGTDSVFKVRLGIVIAGVLFASTHITNALSPDISFVSALRQTISVIPMGVLLGTIYFRSKNNIWPVILLHAFNDFCTFLISGYISNASLGETISGSSNNVAGTLVLFTIVDLWILRKKKLDRIITKCS